MLTGLAKVTNTMYPKISLILYIYILIICNYYNNKYWPESKFYYVSHNNSISASA